MNITLDQAHVLIESYCARLLVQSTVMFLDNGYSNPYIRVDIDNSLLIAEFKYYFGSSTSDIDMIRLRDETRFTRAKIIDNVPALLEIEIGIFVAQANLLAEGQ